LWLLLPITPAISDTLPSAITITIAPAIALAIGNCPLHHCRPLQSPSPLAITIVVAFGNCQELLTWRSKNCIQTI
jgi:hypothetical protein